MEPRLDEVMLTAYALDELSGAEHERAEAAVAGSNEARHFVRQVRATADALTAELAAEAAPGLEAIHYAAIEMRLRGQAMPARSPDPAARRREHVQLALAVAASIVIVGGTISTVLVGLFHRPRVATTRPATTQSSERPLIVRWMPPDAPAEELVPPTPSGAAGTGAFLRTAEHATCTIPLAGDEGAAYARVAQMLLDGQVPPPSAVHIAALVNAFPCMDDPVPPPPGSAAAFAVSVEVARCPWNVAHRLARVSVAARSGAGNVADDVRAEVSFNPAVAASYRPIGFDDARPESAGEGSAGEPLAAGQSVTILFEIIPTASPSRDGADLLSLRIRFREPGSSQDRLAQFSGADHGATAGSAELRFAASVAQFGMLLHERSTGGRSARFGDVLGLATGAMVGRPDPDGRRTRFIEVVRRARELLG